VVHGGTGALQKNYSKFLWFELATVTSQALKYDVVTNTPYEYEGLNQPSSTGAHRVPYRCAITRICVECTTTKETQYTDLWVHLLNVPEYRSIAEKAISMLIQMPATDLCQSGFSYLCETKSRKRSSITHIDPLMREQLKRRLFLGLSCWLLTCNIKKAKYHILDFVVYFM